jgi:hypothetical protein
VEAAMAEEDGGFLSRWSRRKGAAKKGIEVPEQVPPVAPVVPSAAAAPVAPIEPLPPLPPQAVAEAPAAPPPPTLADVAQLTKDSDFKRFIAPDVDPGVKNAAMKKLFASDPHFNVMDGLDVYIDDYNKFEPIPRSMMRQLMSARILGLIDDELEEQPKPDNGPRDDDEPQDAAVQLQPDDAPGQFVAGESAGDECAGDDPHDAVPPRGA